MRRRNFTEVAATLFITGYPSVGLVDYIGRLEIRRAEHVEAQARG